MNKDIDFETFIKGIQKKINLTEEKLFSNTVINEYRNPKNFGLIKNPDAYGEINGPCGDTMKISLKIENNKIKKGCFWTDGCGATLACGNMLIKIIEKKTIDEVSNITKEKLIRSLDGLPEEHIHCAKLTVDTLKKALNDLKKK